MPFFEWVMLQKGTLPLRPDNHFQSVEHRCTSVLICPAETSSPQPTILTDPCFTPRGFRPAVRLMGRFGKSFADIDRYFVTHEHGDHLLRLHSMSDELRLMRARLWASSLPPGITAVHCPGHHAKLHSLVFETPRHEQVWVVGDAVLDEDWLRAWRYYFPNGYTPDEVVQTWRSVATICSQADVIIPGHGVAIRVTRDLIQALVDGFPTASYAVQCGDVADSLRARLTRM